MAAGKPVVGAIDGETARLVNEEARCGICCGAEDAQGLANAIREMAGDDARRAVCGENSRRYYREHFRKERFFETLEAVLQENCV